MDNDFAPSLMFTLNQEGGFSDDPHDPGGPTFQGITLNEYRIWAGNPNLSVADLKAMTPEIVSGIYATSYWGPCFGGIVPAGIDLSVFDMGVNAGPHRSLVIMQTVLGVTADGIVGPKTLAALDGVIVPSMLKKLAKAQGDFYRSLSTFRYFGKGWIARANARYNAAMGLLVGAHAGKAT